MKKIKYIVCALLTAVSFTSCVNDYDEITQEMAVLPGKRSSSLAGKYVYRRVGGNV